MGMKVQQQRDANRPAADKGTVVDGNKLVTFRSWQWHSTKSLTRQKNQLLWLSSSEAVATDPCYKSIPSSAYDSHKLLNTANVYKQHCCLIIAMEISVFLFSASHLTCFFVIPRIFTTFGVTPERLPVHWCLRERCFSLRGAAWMSSWRVNTERLVLPLVCNACTSATKSFTWKIYSHVYIQKSNPFASAPIFYEKNLKIWKIFYKLKNNHFSQILFTNLY